MVLIAVPNTGSIITPLVSTLINLDKKEDVEVDFFNNRPVDCNRNEIVKHFLEETDHEFLCMIDSDITLPDNILDILEYDKDVIAPIMFSMKEGIPYPVVSVFKKGKDDKETLRMFTGSNEELMNVDGVGTGCIFIRRQVLEMMDPPYFDFEKNEDGTLNTGEDLSFCVKVKDMDLDINVATDFVVGHRKEIDLDYVMRLLNLAIKTEEENMYYKEVKERGEDR